MSALYSNLTFERSVWRLESPAREALELPPSWALSVVALNYETFAADIFWVTVLVDFGESLRDHVTPPHLLQNGNVLADLDPQFRRIYDWFPDSAAARLARASEEEIEEINSFIDRGIANFPADGQLPFAAAMNYVGYSSHASTERRLRETNRALAYLDTASQLPGAPETTPFVMSWFVDRRRRLLGDDAEAITESDRKRQIEVLSRALLTVDDDRLRERIRAKLDNLGAGESVAQAAREFERTYQEERTQSELGFVPGDLWLTVTLP